MSRIKAIKEPKRYQGYTPMPHQLAVHRLLDDEKFYKGKIIVVKSRRQVGKSAMIEQELLRFAINKTKSVNGCISPTLAQARKIYNEIYDAIKNSGVVLKKNETLLELKLINGSTIFFKSAEQKENLRGYTISGILCIDECAYIADEIWNIVLPWCNVNRAPILLTSTPRFKDGFYYKYWERGKTRWNKNVIAVDFNDYDTTAMLSKEMLEEYRQMLPQKQFTTEYLGEFVDGDGMVFQGFKDCMMSTKPEYKFIYCGIDWATGSNGDYTVLSMLNEKRQQIGIYRFNNKNTTQQIDKLSSILIPLKPYIKCVFSEMNSIGTPMTELLRKATGIRINEWTTSNSSKCDMITDLCVAFEQKELYILNDEDQERELTMYSCEYNPKTKNVTYNAPLGYNDDMVMALALANQAYKKGQFSKYNIR